MVDIDQKTDCLVSICRLCFVCSFNHGCKIFRGCIKSFLFAVAVLNKAQLHFIDVNVKKWVQLKSINN